MKRIAPMAALVAAALAFSTSPPALATSLTAPQLALELTADLNAGDVGRARHKLHLLHNLGVLTLGRSDLNVESLIDLLIRGHADVVVARLAGAEKHAVGRCELLQFVVVRRFFAELREKPLENFRHQIPRRPHVEDVAVLPPDTRAPPDLVVALDHRDPKTVFRKPRRGGHAADARAHHHDPPGALFVHGLSLKPFFSRRQAPFRRPSVIFLFA